MGHCKGGPHMSYSPAKNQNKGYAKQEKKDLMQDMPIVKDAMGGRSWMSKHSKSALRMGHGSPAEMEHDSPAKHKAEGHEKLEGGFKMYDKQPHTSSAHTMKPKAVAKMKYD